MLGENNVILPSSQLETRTEAVYKTLTTINITTNVTFAYFNISFLASGSSGGSAGGSQAGVTESPESSQATPTSLMRALLQADSVALESRWGFLEVRADTPQEVGTVSGLDWAFSIDPVDVTLRPEYDVTAGGVTGATSRRAPPRGRAS